jgi:hypothetical protein
MVWTVCEDFSENWPTADSTADGTLQIEASRRGLGHLREGSRIMPSVPQGQGQESEKPKPVAPPRPYRAPGVYVTQKWLPAGKPIIVHPWDVKTLAFQAITCSASG